MMHVTMIKLSDIIDTVTRRYPNAAVSFDGGISFRDPHSNKKIGFVTANGRLHWSLKP